MHLRPKPEGWGPGVVYLCQDRPKCRGLMSAHPNGDPQGTPADAPTRRARRLTHDLFDPLWLEAPASYEVTESAGKAKQQAIRAIRGAARRRCYQWLADRLGMSVDACHISEMQLPQLRRAYRVVRDFRRSHGNRAYTEIRRWAKARQ